MRVLTIFLDMIRANRLATFNPEVTTETPIDIKLSELGGTVYSNCFSPGPDTPRGISSYLTGVDPYLNGCNTRLKWPSFFLDRKLSTVFDLFDDKEYKQDLYSSIKERDTGLFPPSISHRDFYNDRDDINEYLSNIVLENNHHVFLAIPDYHWAFDDYGYTRKGETKAYGVVENILDSVFDRFDKDDFEHIFIFSDHGFKFSSEMFKTDRRLLLNEDRTNILMFHRAKDSSRLITNNKLCSLSDMYATYQDILGVMPRKSYSLFSSEEREYVISEEHMSFFPSVNQNIEIWSLTNKEQVYIRTLDSALLIDRKTRSTNEGVIEIYDEFIKDNSSFLLYYDEYKKVFNYIKNIKNTNPKYSNGVLRSRRSKWVVNIEALIEKVTKSR